MSDTGDSSSGSTRGAPAHTKRPSREDAERNERVRDNQRRARQRRRDHLADLEGRIRRYELGSVNMSAEVQQQARRVARENNDLHQLLSHLGINSSHITPSTAQPTADSVSPHSSSAQVRELHRIMQPRGRQTPPPQPQQPSLALPAVSTWAQAPSSIPLPGFQSPQRPLSSNHGDPHWTPTDRNPSFDFSQYRNPEAHVPNHERDLIMPPPGSPGRSGRQQRRQQRRQEPVLPSLGSFHQDQHQQYSNQVHENQQYQHTQHQHRQDFFLPPPVSVSPGQQQQQHDQYQTHGQHGLFGQQHYGQQYNQQQSFVLPPPGSTPQPYEQPYQDYQQYGNQQQYQNQHDEFEYLSHCQMNLLKPN